MQFVANGPEIPDELLQAHEDGRVVFFCGAGISVPAGLPGFKKLVEDIYELAGAQFLPNEAEAFSSNRFDATLDLLEHRFPGQRLAVRRLLEKALKPNLRLKGSLDTHSSLLQLATSRDGALRLVTTNFDALFEKAAKRDKQKLPSFSAPMLPVPKNSRWNGLVYLHGAMPEQPSDSDLNRLILTSGDFGLAYLIERWAARFVGELLKNYVVCFVGYGINDPVLRYMMDALAADRMLGESVPQAFAFADCAPNQQRQKTIEWEAKGVKPILYTVPTNSQDHSALHNTIQIWADTYKSGTTGKERIVVEYALAKPSMSTEQDNFVGRMLWALADPSGLPARRFADVNPVPTLEWLFDTFSNEVYSQKDLSRFGVIAETNHDGKFRFSLVRRPAPYRRTVFMNFASHPSSQTQWDDQMFNIGRWLVRHLNDPRLVLWLVERGGLLHERLAWLIDERLNEIVRLEIENRTSELEAIRTHAPSAIPNSIMKTLWRLLLAGRMKSQILDLDLHTWRRRLQRDGLTTILRLQLRELLAPKLLLRKPLNRLTDIAVPASVESLRDLVDWELTLAADHVGSSLEGIKDELWQSILPALFDEFQLLLNDALGLLKELGEADENNDPSYWDLPSISNHWQNRSFREWIILIELVRDSWLKILANNATQAANIAQNWFQIPYPTFKRLALFAATQNASITSQIWVEWLIEDQSRWLWSIDTRREVLRLLVLQGLKLNNSTQDALEEAILSGPPREMFKADLTSEQFQKRRDRTVWLYLSKLDSSGISLSTNATSKLSELSKTYPDWKLANNERDEFPHWMTGTDDPDYESPITMRQAPTKRNHLVTWLKDTPQTRKPFDDDNWNEICRKHMMNSLFALYDVTQEGNWRPEQWRDALHNWSSSKKNLVRRSWQYGAPLIQHFQNEHLKDIVNALSGWLEASSKSINYHSEIFLGLIEIILNFDLDVDTGILLNNEPINEPVAEAINHPIGKITQALLNYWFKNRPNDNEMLHGQIRLYFTQICNLEVDRYKHGRVLLAANLIPLFRVDRLWTEQNLLPLFDWSANLEETRAIWNGFLWSPRLYRPLLIAFKPQFLAAANHYIELANHAENYAAFLTYVALEPIEGYSRTDFQSAIAKLPSNGLLRVAEALTQALEGAGEQREEYWKNRIQPFWQFIWPKSNELISAELADPLIRLCIAAGAEFPSALTNVKHWLTTLEHSHYALHQLKEAGLCKQFPSESLTMLGLIIGDQRPISRELKECLEEIINATPSLGEDSCYMKLHSLVIKFS